MLIQEKPLPEIEDRFQEIFEVIISVLKYIEYIEQKKTQLDMDKESDDYNNEEDNKDEDKTLNEMKHQEKDKDSDNEAEDEDFSLYEWVICF